jgi:lipopolysaccharide/colanic/teichoic acid biosynthesis glycosyltransferase
MMSSPVAKRILDVTLSAGAIIVLAPVFIFVAIAIRVILGSPVLFRQVRPGLGGRPFVMYKFRTMNDGRDQQGTPLPDEARLSRFGRFLRATSLDELPELWNVLAGDMSLVGPRPLLMSYLPLYSDAQRRRHEVRPGITGWAQVHGRNQLPWERKFELDAWYVDHQSIRLDLRILWLTVARVIRAEGISQTGHVSAEPFTGDRQ